MLRDQPPFRADHVGSLLRPASLLAARAAHAAGQLSDDALAATENDAIRAIVADQERIGLRGITDGEFRREYWHLDFMFGFDGIKPSTRTYTNKFSGGLDFEGHAAEVTGKIGYPAGGIMRSHFQFLSALTSRTAKFTIPSPAMFRHRAASKAVIAPIYPDIDAFWADLGQAYKAAVADYAELGCRYLQIDDVNSCMLCDARVRREVTEMGEDPDALLATFIRTTNTATAARPADMAITTHLCRGNFQSQHAGTGGYEAIAETLLNDLDVDGFFMEYDSERAGDFAPLRFLPKGKIAVLGIMTTKTPDLESADDLRRRIDEAAQYVDLEQVCISPQCGFSSTHHGNKLTVDDQWRKLARLVEVADAVWG